MFSNIVLPDKGILLVMKVNFPINIAITPQSTSLSYHDELLDVFN